MKIRTPDAGHRPERERHEQLGLEPLVSTWRSTSKVRSTGSITR